MLLGNNRSSKLTERLQNVSIAVRMAESYLKQKLLERSQLANKKVCDRYFKESNTPKKIFKVWSEPRTSFHDVTLVTFMTAGKFAVLDMALRQWPGPLSLAIYVDDKACDMLLLELEKRPYFLEKKHVELSIIPGVFVSIYIIVMNCSP